MRDFELAKKEIARRLKASRKATGMTQEQLAERVGIETQSYSNIECGKRLFSVDLLLRLIEVLNVSADYILTGKHSMKTPITEALDKMDPKDAARVERIVLLFQETADKRK